MSLFPPSAVAMMADPGMAVPVVEFITALAKELPDDTLALVSEAIGREWEERQSANPGISASSSNGAEAVDSTISGKGAS